MHKYLILALRLGIAGAVLVGAFGQAVVIPGMAAHEVDRFPPYAPYAVPYVTVAILGVACIQVALIATWMLLSMVSRNSLFSTKAFRWVDTIIGSSTVATLLSLAVSVHLFFAPIPSPADGMELIGALMGAIACVAIGASFTILVVILRGLLRKATDLQTEMSAVV